MSLETKPVFPLIRMKSTAHQIDELSRDGDAVQALSQTVGFVFGYEHAGKVHSFFQDAHPDSPLVDNQERVGGIFGAPLQHRLFVVEPDRWQPGYAVQAHSAEHALTLIQADLDRREQQRVESLYLPVKGLKSPKAAPLDLKSVREVMVGQIHAFD